MLDQAVWLAASCVCLASLLYRKKSLKLRNHENPLVQGYRRLDPHVVVAAFGSETQARTHVMQAKCSSNVIDLGGIWKFRIFKNVNEALMFKEKFEDIDQRVPYTNIVVPGSWQVSCSMFVSPRLFLLGQMWARLNKSLLND